MLAHYCNGFCMILSILTYVGSHRNILLHEYIKHATKIKIHVFCLDKQQRIPLFSSQKANDKHSACPCWH